MKNMNSLLSSHRRCPPSKISIFFGSHDFFAPEQWKSCKVLTSCAISAAIITLAAIGLASLALSDSCLVSCCMRPPHICT